MLSECVIKQINNEHKNGPESLSRKHPMPQRYKSQRINASIAAVNYTMAIFNFQRHELEHSHHINH